MWTVRKKIDYEIVPGEAGSFALTADPVINFLHGAVAYTCFAEIAGL